VRVLQIPGEEEVRVRRQRFRNAACLLTGGVDIQPALYGEGRIPEAKLDAPAPDRDQMEWDLLTLAREERMPVFGICRGHQTLNVFLGGSLYQQVHAESGLMDHREPTDVDLEAQFSDRHEVTLTPGSAFAEWAGGTQARVNSLHGQGVDRIAPGLRVEAVARDGLVEALRLDRDDRFLLAVQWHPEWKLLENPFYLGIFRAFGDACRARAARRTRVRSIDVAPRLGNVRRPGARR
jgi:putative glutamine amidotransferase